MIAQHTIDGDVLERLWGGFWVDQAVPAFLVLMAYNAAGSFERQGARTLAQAYSRTYVASRLNRLVWPAAGIYLAIATVAAAQGRLHVGPLVVLGAAPLDGGAPGDYFVGLAIALAALLPGVWLACQRAPRAGPIVLLTVSAGFELAARPLLYGSSTGAYLDAACPLRAAAAVAAGFWLAEHGGPRAVLAPPRRLLTGAAIASAAYLLALHFDSLYGSEDAFGFLFPNFTAETGVWAIGWSLAMVAVGVARLDAFPGVPTRMLVQLGQASYHVFLVQAAVLGLWPPATAVGTVAKVALALAGGYLWWRLRPLKASLALMLLVAVVALAIAEDRDDASPLTADPPSSSFRLFAADSIWNLRLRSDAPIDPGSRAAVGWLKAKVATRGAWMTSHQCGMPILWVPPGTPRVAVRLDRTGSVDAALVRAWRSVPLPRAAKPANCPDRNLAILQRRPGGRVALWEFWKLRRSAQGWSARWGGVTQDVARDRGIASSLGWRSPGSRDPRATVSSSFWNVTASSISMVAGVVTVAELRRRRIDHALAMALPDTAQGRYLWPAQRTDGSDPDPDAVPEGAHLRLDPRLDLGALELAPLARMLAEAAQRYGIVVRDRTADRVSFIAEEPPSGVDVMTRLLAGQDLAANLAGFPWDRLQLLERPECTWRARCQIASRVRIDVDRRPGAPGFTLDTSNSLLEQPRARVDWDLDGDGRFETGAGTRVTQHVTPASPGRHAVAVRIVMRGGRVARGAASIQGR